MVAVLLNIMRRDQPSSLILSIGVVDIWIRLVYNELPGPPTLYNPIVQFIYMHSRKERRRKDGSYNWMH